MQTSSNLKTQEKINSAVYASQKHPFHILGPSPLPFLSGLFLFSWLVLQLFSRPAYEAVYPLLELETRALAGPIVKLYQTAQLEPSEPTEDIVGVFGVVPGVQFQLWELLAELKGLHIREVQILRPAPEAEKAFWTTYWVSELSHVDFLLKDINEDLLDSSKKVWRLGVMSSKDITKPFDPESALVFSNENPTLTVALLSFKPEVWTRFDQRLASKKVVFITIEIYFFVDEAPLKLFCWAEKYKEQNTRLFARLAKVSLVDKFHYFRICGWTSEYASGA